MLKDLIRQNRSYRGYDESRKVTKEELMDMVECARLAPSSINMQPLKYFLAWTPEVTKKIQPLTQWAKALPEITLPHEGHCPTAFIVICQDMNWNSSTTVFQRDVGIVAQTMLLAAVEMGLGGCMIGSFNKEELHKVLELPDHIVPSLVVAIGKPDEKIVLTDVKEDGNTKYYRDEADVHYVPKRHLEDIVLF